ncbi:MAG: ribonuclease BN, partial [Pseudomonadota bacterium]|nr:ribonuclease BN [Pseudomonadota bacterium]
MDEKLTRYKLQISIFLKQQTTWWMQYLNRCIDDQ